MNPPEPRIDWTAVASVWTAIVGVMLWPTVGGWAGLLAATLSLVLGFLALSHIKRNGHTGRLAAFVGIGYGVVSYVIIAMVVVWDLVNPVRLNR